MVFDVQAFVEQISGHEGAEVPGSMNPDVSFDDPAFWRELKAVLGVAADQQGVDLDLPSDSASSSDGFSNDDDDGDGDSQYSATSASSNSHSEGDKPAAPPHAKGSSSKLPHGRVQAGLQGLADNQYPAPPYDISADASQDSGDSSDVLTATDSDDDGDAGDAGFMQAYDEVLADELSDSRVGSILAPAQTASTAGANAVHTQGSDDKDLKPVDLDTNLVRNLLQSYTAQQGLAGPAGNLAGLLGLELPANVDVD